MSSDDTGFIETKEYQRFQEFCDACRTYQYIGLCYGVPGVGKTVSAHYYTNPKKVGSVMAYPPSEGRLEKGLGSRVVLYTPCVVNNPAQIGRDLGMCRSHFSTALLQRFERQEKRKLEELEESMTYTRGRGGELAGAYDRHRDAYFAASKEYRDRRRELRHEPVLLVIDEADRLRMGSLEQVRAIFDQGGMGVVLIGMPGLEKRLTRYPQLYSRVGFVHEFRPLPREDVQRLLREGWTPSDSPLPEEGLIDEEALATLIRIAEGKFRLLHRLLQQISRVLQVNRLDKVTREVVEAARDNLVIGAA